MNIIIQKIKRAGAYFGAQPKTIVRQQAVVAPMGSARREAAYLAQTGRADLTARQARRLRQKENR